MTYIKWGAIGLIMAVIFAVFHYSLLSYDVVRIVKTEVKLLDQPGQDADGNDVTVKDDVYFITSVDADGNPHVYRNEDNGWYLKFDSSNLDAEASNLISAEDNPRWVVVTHYGWRVTYLSMWPNAIAVREVASPDDRPFPWFNLIFVVLLVVTILVLRRILIILRERHVDPVVEAIDEEIDGSVSWWRRLLGLKKRKP